MENRNYLGTEKVGTLFAKIRNPVYLFPHYLVPLQYRGSDICWKRRWVSWQRRYWRDFPDYGNRLGPKPILW